jgi:hypothetical protein
VVSSAPLALLITPQGTHEGPDAALLLALNPTDAATVLNLPAELPRGWVRYLDSAATKATPDTGEPLTDAAATVELTARGVALLGLPVGPEG